MKYLRNFAVEVPKHWSRADRTLTNARVTASVIASVARARRRFVTWDPVTDEAFVDTILLNASDTSEESPSARYHRLSLDLFPAAIEISHERRCNILRNVRCIFSMPGDPAWERLKKTLSQQTHLAVYEIRAFSRLPNVGLTAEGNSTENFARTIALARSWLNGGLL